MPFTDKTTATKWPAGILPGTGAGILPGTGADILPGTGASILLGTGDGILLDKGRLLWGVCLMSEPSSARYHTH